MLKTKEFLDGIQFIKDGVIVAFYAYDLHRVEILNREFDLLHKEFRPYEYSPLTIEEMKYIVKIVEARGK